MKYIAAFLMTIMLWIFARRPVRDVIRSMLSSKEIWGPEILTDGFLLHHDAGRVSVRIISKDFRLSILLDGEPWEKLTPFENHVLLRASVLLSERNKSTAISKLMGQG